MPIKEGVDDLAALEKSFGIPSGYIDELKNEDDWSLIIKAHALLESAVADMLTHYFGKYQLGDIFAGMEMSNKTTGKMAFVSKLELLGKKERRFIAKLSELRNEVVHNASNVTFDLKSYVAALSKQKQSEMLKSLNVRLQSITTSGRRLEGDQLILEVPTLVIWASLVHVLGQIFTQDLFAIARSTLISDCIEMEKVNGPIKIDPEKINLTRLR